MPLRLKKLIGLFAILAFLAAYVVLAVTVGEFVPKHWAAQLLYYGVVGTFWGVPLIPLVRWMNRET